MLQFVLGLSFVNLSWLVGSKLASSAYNVPPLFFVAMIVFCLTRFYSFSLKRDGLLFIGLVAALGVLSAALQGYSYWHVRQTLAFIASACVWLFLYQEASRRDIYTASNTITALGIYTAYAFVVLSERYLFETANVAQAIGTLFSPQPTMAAYALAPNPRLPYFSNEPSSAAYAIAAVIMPLVCANAVVNRTSANLGLVVFACAVMFLAEGMTSQVLAAFSLAFVLVPRLSVLMVPISTVAVFVVAFTFASVLDNRVFLIDLLWNTFGGVWSRLDSGLLTGSYLSRLSTWFIGARTFLDAPVLGQGFGGSAAYFFTLADAGYDVFVTPEQRAFYYDGVAPFNAQMVLRIPAELGIVGASLIALYSIRILKMAFGPARAPRLEHYAFLYVLGAMLISFNLTAEYANPMISAFVVLLAQLRRKQKEVHEETPSPLLLPSPESVEQGAVARPG